MMRIIAPTMLLLLTFTAPLLWAEEDGFEPMFDGQTLQGWDGDPAFWSVEDGVITGRTTPENPTRGNTFLIWRAGEVADFEMKLQYKIVGGNSGVQYRSFEIPDQKWVIGGYQADIDSGDRYSGILYGEKFRGILADRGQKTIIKEGGKVEVVGSVGDSDEIQKQIKKEQWNDYHIIARGNHFVHKINGVVTAEATDEDSAARAKGLVALQLHAGPPMTVQFRNIRLKRLEPKQPAAKPDNAQQQSAKRVVFVAGKPSHGYGAHEHYAGCVLLAKALQQAMPGYKVDVYRNGWPEDEAAFEGVDAVVIYSDGGNGHPVIPHLEQVDRLADQKVGIVCLHYAVEVPKGEPGAHLLKWIGGYFEAHWSVNPHWTAKFEKLPEHPVTRGVQPFEINDEWYYHMRFRENMAGVTPILTDLPPKETLSRPDGHHSGNPHVRQAIAQGQPQHVAWASERPGGGRGFGFTGGHVHWNWGDPNFRKVVLNAIVWAAQGEVPSQGVGGDPVSLADLEANQDFPQPADFNRDAIRQRLKRSDQAAADSSKTSAAAAASDSSAATPSQQAAPRSAHAPQQATAQLETHPGVRATLFAAEPMLSNPTNIDIDHLGRVWVCEVINYRRFRNGEHPERTEGDRILVLEDTDGDGQLDKSTTFYQGRDVDSAHGICVLPADEGTGIRALVSAGDSVFWLIDQNGDLKADDKELMFTGIAGTQHDHGIHAFIFGPDGKLYFNFGNEGKQIKDAQGRPIIDMAGNEVNDSRQPYQQGMAFRCNLDGSQFETLGWNFRNNWELCVDSFGNIWQSDNDDDGNRGTRINFVIEFGNYGYRDEMTGAAWKEERTNMEAEIPLQHWHLNDPGVVPNLLQTGAGSPTGICVYEADLLPEVFRDEVIHCDAGPNVVRCYPVKPDGAGYSAESVTLLDGAKYNQWFRPSDVCVAPDGSLVVADWYDPGVGGHRMEDVQRGRLFRVLPEDHSGEYAAPALDVTNPAGAVAALQSPNLVARSIAWRALHRMGAAAEEELLKLYQSQDSRMQARALWLLGKIAGRESHYVKRAVADENPDLRIVGIRLARQTGQDLISLVRSMQDDESPQVRRELALALRHHTSPEAAELWAALAQKHDGQDRWYLEALGIAADGQWDRYLDAWLSVAGEKWNTPAGRDIIWRSRARQTPALLARILKDPSLPADEQPRYFRAFDFLSGPEKDKALETLLSL